MNVEYELSYVLTRESRIDLLKSTGEDDTIGHVTVGHGDDEWERAVDLIGQKCQIMHEESRAVSWKTMVPGKHRHGMTASALLDILELKHLADRAAELSAKEAAAAEHEDAVVALARGGPRSIICNTPGYQCADKNPATHDSKWNVIRWLPEDDRCSETIAVARALCAEHNEEIDAARKSEELAAKEAEVQERNDWIGMNGSNRLQRLLVEEIEHKAVYRDERLCCERPGWAWLISLTGDTTDPRNPPEVAFETLDDARKICKTAYLQRYTIEHEHDEECGDGGCKKYDLSLYVAEDMFLGRHIVFFPKDTPEVIRDW